MFRKLYHTLLLTSSFHLSQAQTVFQFQGKEIKPGTTENFMVPVTSGNDATFIPITVFSGAKQGKTIGITAGVHGYEYAPILGAQRLTRSIDAKKLEGVVILVQIANFESFKGRSPYVNPIDKKNLNRSFPGSANGTLTDQVAHFITEQVIAKSDFFLDMHSGDAPEDLYPYGAYYSNSKMPEISKLGKEMAIALGYEYLVNFNTDGKKYMDKNELSLYCTAEAFKRGIPSVDIECGRLGLIEASAVGSIEKSVLNLLAHLKMLPKEKAPNSSPKPKEILSRSYLSSKNNGFFYPLKKAGDIVKKGTQLGYTTDYFGNTIEKFYAEEEGLILMILSTPPVNIKEDVVVVGKL
ncbi:M14 family metallopeptidase [Pedobacter aquatilis]|uniref:succinylglutamate desuccinylase/aspartoacylase family protein n=1 Tax=Pedobacter aquatilis TaxID=351343 RepID=UPI00292FA4BD|nr:M14 family metallopeptidase [Pedobacter aquatilis]